MSELWWASLECEAGNDVVHYETIQQHAFFCYELQYKIVKSVCVCVRACDSFILTVYIFYFPNTSEKEP